MRRTTTIASITTGWLFGAACFGTELGERLEAAYESLDVATLAELLPRELPSQGAARGWALDRSPLGGMGPIDGLGFLRQGIDDLQVDVQRLSDTDEIVVLHSRFSGRFTRPLTGIEANGLPVAFTGLDVFAIEDGAVVSHWGETDHYGLLNQLTMAVPRVSEVAPAPAEIVHAFAPGTFLECLQETATGRLYVSKLLAGEIVAIEPGGDPEVVARFPGLRPGAIGFICIVLDADDTLYASFDAAGSTGVWRVTPDGESEQFAALPRGAAPNGITLDGRGGLIVADNVSGLWRVDIETREAARWIEHPLLEQREFIGRLPAANGVQRGPDGIYVANSDRGYIVRVPIDRRGRPGTPVVHATGMPGDDFAVASDGTLYVTTHPFNTVIEVTPDGARRTIGSIAQSVLGPTSVIIERGGRSLLVATDGGLFAPVPGVEVPPAIVRLQLDSEN